MLSKNRVAVVACGCLCLVSLVGCGSTEHAVVDFSYTVDATRGLPEGMRTIMIVPAKLGPTTDEQWSDMCTTIMQSLVNESKNDFGTDIVLTDRRDTQITFDEADLAAAGMSKGGGQGGQLDAAQGAILSNINVKVEKYIGRQRTLSGFNVFGGGGRGYGHGGGSVHTEEVETVSRNVTVQTSFKLLDSSNNRVWEYYSPKTFRATEKTKASPIFGSSQTEAELTPQDAIIATLVERGAREFISRLMPCRIDVEAEVESSRHENCVLGVKLLRAEDFEAAASNFKLALQDNPDDSRAAFGAGIACEASGRYKDALKYYNQACMAADNATYRDARNRMKTYANRIRG